MTSIDIKYSRDGEKSITQPSMEGPVRWKGIGMVEISHINYEPDLIQVKWFQRTEDEKMCTSILHPGGRVILGRNSVRLEIVHQE